MAPDQSQEEWRIGTLKMDSSYTEAISTYQKMMTFEKKSPNNTTIISLQATPENGKPTV